MWKTIIVYIAFLLLQLTSVGIAEELEVASSLEEKILFYCGTSDVQSFLSQYETSAIYRFLNEPEPKSLISPVIRQVNQLLDFWFEHFHLSGRRLRGMIKDNFVISVVLVSPVPLVSLPRPVTLISFRPDSAALGKWLGEFEKNLPEDAERRILRINDIKLTSLHYYIKHQVDDSELFKSPRSDKHKIILPKIYQEREVFISYGFYKEYFLLAIGEPSRVRKALSEPTLITAMCPLSTQTNSSVSSFQLWANLETLSKAKIIKGKFFQQALSIFNIHRAKMVCLLHPNELRLNIKFFRQVKSESSANSSGKEDKPFRYASMIPCDAEYFLIATINWAEAWVWFNKNVAHISQKYQRHQNAVLENLSKNTETLLDEFFTRAPGQEVMLFPVQLKSEDTQTTYSQIVLFIELRDYGYFSSILRRVLRLVAQVTYFELSEQNLDGGRLYVLKEQRPEGQEAREIVFWVGKGFVVVSGSKETITTLLTQPRSNFSVYARIPLLKEFSLRPVFVLSWRSFNLSSLLTTINSTARTLQVDLRDFNKEVLNIEQYIPSSKFSKYFSNANLFVLPQRDKTEIIFQLLYK